MIKKSKEMIITQFRAVINSLGGEVCDGEGVQGGFWGVDNILLLDYSGRYVGICFIIITKSSLHTTLYALFACVTFHNEKRSRVFYFIICLLLIILYWFITL